jgi:hypothetical protein
VLHIEYAGFELPHPLEWNEFGWVVASSYCWEGSELARCAKPEADFIITGDSKGCTADRFSVFAGPPARRQENDDQCPL